MLLSLFVKMQTTLAGIRSRMENEDGAVATEYVVLLVLIAIAARAASSAALSSFEAGSEGPTKWSCSEV